MWYLNCRSNDKHLEKFLRKIEVHREVHEQSANEFRGIHSLRHKFSPSHSFPLAGLLIGQYPIDLALVERGVIRTLGDEDILDKIIKKASTLISFTYPLILQ